VGVGPAAGLRFVEQAVDLGQSVEHHTAILYEFLGSGIQVRTDRGREQGGLHGLSIFVLTPS
jgi:hypothetical protein